MPTIILIVCQCWPMSELIVVTLLVELISTLLHNTSTLIAEKMNIQEIPAVTEIPDADPPPVMDTSISSSPLGSPSIKKQRANTVVRKA